MSSKSHALMNYIVNCTQIFDEVQSIPITNDDDFLIRLQKQPVGSAALRPYAHFHEARAMTSPKRNQLLIIYYSSNPI